MERTFTLGESSEDVLENVCFMVLRIKKRRCYFYFFLVYVPDII